ncbi:reverse transcriptase domain-containing protein [Trichonephila clavata]|uniref:Reverse transcriptase domain-containing protein n=1 Tax=Trichonephila clavata TaxID=2740835 RepID=A0A8X6L2H9_TRICU|nr:reverse transcriptase domain-containing protein [Trichonephila clavata]
MLTVHTFQSERPTKHVYPKVRIRVKSLISNKEIEIEALETKQLSSAHISIPAKEVRERFGSLGLELEDVPVALDKGACEIGLLVGSDNYWKFVGNRIERLDESLLENLGIEVEEDIKGISENEVLKSSESSIEYSSNRYKVLPWKPEMKHLLDDNRENPIAYTADIEKAFLQIELHEQDRDVARFLWTENLNDYDPKNLQVYRLTRVLFGLTSSPFMLAATIRHHLKKYKDKFPDTAKIVESSLYVDDFISGQENVDKALQTSLESIEIFKEAGMSLRKWHTKVSKVEDDTPRVARSAGFALPLSSRRQRLDFRHSVGYERLPSAGMGSYPRKNYGGIRIKLGL